MTLDSVKKWTVKSKLEKFHNDKDFIENKPFEVMEMDGNSLLDEGINLLWNLVCGAAGTAFSNANAFIGVGDSSTAAVRTQTGLQGSNKFYKAMDATYPQSGASAKAVFKSTFASSEANFAWNEWSVANGNGTAGDTSTVINLNRKVESMGTKASGSTWVLTVEISLT